MNKFLKDLAQLFTNLNEAEGFAAVVEINEIEMLYENHVAELKKEHLEEFNKTKDERIKI